MESVAFLISNGHINAWQYGYTFFLRSLSSVKKQKKYEIVEMAAAIGLAFSGKKDAIRDFLKD